MSNKFDEMRQAVQEAEYTLRAADNVTAQMGRLIQSRLRQCDTSTLEEMKRELRDFNIHTGQWK